MYKNKFLYFLNLLTVNQHINFYSRKIDHKRFLIILLDSMHDKHMYAFRQNVVKNSACTLSSLALI